VAIDTRELLVGPPEGEGGSRARPDEHPPSVDVAIRRPVRQPRALEAVDHPAGRGGRQADTIRERTHAHRPEPVGEIEDDDAGQVRPQGLGEDELVPDQDRTQPDQRPRRVQLRAVVHAPRRYGSRSPVTCGSVVPAGRSRFENRARNAHVLRGTGRG
jgi:hypothetical protein